MTGFRACGVIPSRNHYKAIGEVVGALRGAGLPVLIIDDASDEPARSNLAALHAPAGGVTVHRLDRNQGKGGAVMTGFELAAASGFTHVVQVDADGQHDLVALPALLAAAERHPGDLVLGTPLYDASAPRARAIGRWVTRIWVWIETLSLDVADAMCGFRVYPLAAVVPLIREERLGRRMDFDIEVVVRLLWRGVAPRPVRVAVRYPDENTSNFDVLRDNWRISKMHARLVFAMLARLPAILRNRRGSGAAPSHWSGLGERGLYCGLWLLALVYRVAGRRACLAALLPVVAFFHASGRQQREASREFLARVACVNGAPPPGRLAGFRHSLGFARKALDTFAAWIGRIGPAEVEIATPDVMVEAAAERRGLVLVVSHLGNVELSRAVLDPERRARTTVLVHTRHAENYNRILRRFRPEAAVNLLEVTEIGPGTAVALQELAERGHWVAIAGDRTPVGTGRRVSRVPFLGADAAFPQGPYLLAHLLQCPVYLLFCLREEGRHRVYLEKFAERIELPRRGKEEALAFYAACYAERLEAYCRRAPLQWYNFFDFWAPEPVEPRAS